MTVILFFVVSFTLHVAVASVHIFTLVSGGYTEMLKKVEICC